MTEKQKVLERIKIIIFGKNSYLFNKLLGNYKQFFEIITC